jgi:hypothetical protein
VDSAAPDQATPYGYFDGVVGGEATGWCWRPSAPTERLQVEVFVDGASVGSGRAQGRRENVARAGYGDGRYGFRIRLPAVLADGGSHRIAVQADGAPLTPAPTFLRGSTLAADDPWAGTVFEPDGPGGPVATASEGGGAATARRAIPGLGWLRRRRPSESEADLAGYIDGVTGDELFGWVVDPARPTAALKVAAFFDRLPLGVADADLARPDVARAGYGDRHGFRFSLGGRLGPGIHVVEVSVEDSEGLEVPLASDYVVVDGAGEPVPGVSLRGGSGAAPPPPLATPAAALLGRDGWLFEWPGETEFALLCGAAELDPEIVELQQLQLLERHELVRTAGAHLVEAIVPAKLAVYADYLPSGIELCESRRPADLLSGALRERNELEVLDLRAALRQARSHGEVYARTARTLTWLGGFAAYRVIAKRLATAGHPLTPILRSGLEFAELEPVGEHLAGLPRMVWIGSQAVPAGTAAEDEEQEGRARLDWSCLATEYAVLPPELAAVAGSRAALLRRREPGENPDGLVIHDGSAERIAPFLAEHFERTLLVGAGADIEAVLTELGPAAVFEVVAESTWLRVAD